MWNKILLLLFIHVYFPFLKCKTLSKPGQLCREVFKVDGKLLTNFENRYRDPYQWMKYRPMWKTTYRKFINPWFFRQAVLCYHNYYRQFHDASPLKLSYKLNKRAQNWAETMAERKMFRHSPSTPGVGENIYRGHFVTAGEVVNAFYDEIQLYDYRRPYFSRQTGHFTQLVWKGSKELGVGIAASKKDPNNFYVVVNYSPPGNVDHPKIFAQNVLPCAPASMCDK